MLLCAQTRALEAGVTLQAAKWVVERRLRRTEQDEQKWNSVRLSLSDSMLMRFVMSSESVRERKPNEKKRE